MILMRKKLGWRHASTIYSATLAHQMNKKTHVWCLSWTIVTQNLNHKQFINWKRIIGSMHAEYITLLTDMPKRLHAEYITLCTAMPMGYQCEIYWMSRSHEADYTSGRMTPNSIRSCKYGIEKDDDQEQTYRSKVPLVSTQGSSGRHNSDGILQRSGWCIYKGLSWCFWFPDFFSRAYLDFSRF